jgi:glycosyltransferase involved in cell wall biosynthesis
MPPFFRRTPAISEMMMTKLYCDYTNFRQITPPKIFQVMPRGMYFGESRATSIDLCVRDLMLASRRDQDALIYAEEVDDPFGDFPINPLPSNRKASSYHRAKFVAAQARRLKPDLIVVQQHLPTAAAIALRAPGAKVVLHTHNFQKSYESSPGISGWLKRAMKKLRYRRLAGIIHVSSACEEAFARDWPELSMPSCVVNNGLDFSAWRPAAERSNEIVYAGRCAPEKGVIELALALQEVLPLHPEWRARFILSAVDAHPRYFEKVTAVLAGFGEQVIIQLQQPFEAVKSAYERAAIAAVPSICSESFGRTALEAHAGGAALISSGRGGLAEVSGPHAIKLAAVEPEEIGKALELLIRDKTLRARLAIGGARRVRERFNIHSQAEKFSQFCAMLSGRHRPGNVEHQAIEPFSSAA